MRKIETPVNAKKGLFCVVFSRTGIILLLLLLQFGFMIESFRYLEAYLPYIYGALMILEAMVVIHVINTKGNPAFKMTWILCIMAFPAVGTLFYIYVELQVGTRWVGEKLKTLKLEESPYMIQENDIIEEIRESKPAMANLAFYLSDYLRFPTYRKNETKNTISGYALIKQLKSMGKIRKSPLAGLN